MCASNNSLISDTDFMRDCYLSTNTKKIDAKIAYPYENYAQFSDLMCKMAHCAALTLLDLLELDLLKTD